jgi:hypothetical protein
MGMGQAHNMAPLVFFIGRKLPLHWHVVVL